MKTGPKKVKIRKDAEGHYIQVKTGNGIKKMRLTTTLQPMAAAYSIAKIFVTSDGEPVITALTKE